MALVNLQLRDQYAQLHSRDQYGAGAGRFALQIQACISDLKPIRILDYGCGQSNLSDSLELGTGTFHRYDPAIPRFSEIPVPSADFMINTDVMEHIPAPDLPEVLQHMRSISSCVFFNIATRKASQILPDGQNAHCTVMTAGRWLECIRQVYPESELVAEHPGQSCLIITWRSTVLSVLAGIERLRGVEMQRDEYLQGPVHRVRGKVRSLIRRATGRPDASVILYPHTRQNSAA